MSANAGSKPAFRPGERVIVLTRVFDAPRDLVFEMWTNPVHLAQWWGPKGFTNPVCEVDLKVGGRWHIVMRAPNGEEFPCRGEYREIRKPERLAFTNIAVDQNDQPVLDGFTSVTFEDLGGKTKLTIETGAAPMVEYAARYLDGMEMGWTMSLEKLAETLGAQ